MTDKSERFKESVLPTLHGDPLPDFGGWCRAIQEPGVGSAIRLIGKRAEAGKVEQNNRESGLLVFGKFRLSRQREFFRFRSVPWFGVLARQGESRTRPGCY